MASFNDKVVRYPFMLYLCQEIDMLKSKSRLPSLAQQVAWVWRQPSYWQLGVPLSLADLNEAALKKAIESLPGSHEKHLVVPVDVRKIASVDAWIERTVQHFGKLDGAVNMAGVLGPTGAPVTDITDEQLNLVLSVNVNGVFNCLHAQLKVIKTGSIVSFTNGRAITRHY